MPVTIKESLRETPSLEAEASNLAAILDRHRYLVLLVLTVIYTVGAVLHARGKPLWYDEIITTFASSAPDVTTTWKAAQQIDVNPPLPHVLIHFSMRCLRNLEVSTRIPAIVGFWILCLCVYRFTRRRVGIYYALAALLLPIVTNAYSYSVEARAYGPELAFCGLALIAWQAAAERSWRIPALILLAASIVAATLCHYYAILIYLPLAGGEAARWRRSGKFDAGIWTAFLFGGTGLVLRLPVILGAAKWTSHSWAKPSWEQMIEFWTNGLQPLSSFIVLFTALMALSIVAARNKPDTGLARPVTLEDHELLAGVLFLVLPSVAVAGALFVTHMFTPRYALPALIGFAYLAPMIAAHLSRGSALFGLTLASTLTVSVFMTSIDIPAVENPYRQEPILQKALEKESVVVPDGLLFLKMWQYAPDNLKSRLQFVADDAAAIQYMQTDIIDEGLLVLRPWTSARIVEYKNFFAPGREFLVYQNTIQAGWLLSKVIDDGGSAKVEAYSGYRELVRVKFKQ